MRKFRFISIIGILGMMGSCNTISGFGQDVSYYATSIGTSMKSTHRESYVGDGTNIGTETNPVWINSITTENVDD